MLKGGFFIFASMESIISNAEYVVKAFLAKDGSGHDWWHIHRVRNNALMLAKAYPEADLQVVELAALLHDMGDYKLHNNDVEAGNQFLNETINSLSVDTELRKRIIEVIAQVSYKGAGIETKTTTIEAAIVQDADRLDAIGAIGVARAFAYGGSKQRLMYDPNQKPESHDDFESYRNAEGTTINHFYEKLLLLKDRMQTDEGKKLAVQRTEYMKQFLSQFYAEWNGER